MTLHHHLWKAKLFSDLIHLIPDWVEIFLDHVTLKLGISDMDLNVGVTLALHHAPHQVVLGNQILGLQQVDPQHPLQDKDCNGCRATTVYFETVSVHKLPPVNPTNLSAKARLWAGV